MQEQTSSLLSARRRVAEGLQRVGLAGPAYRLVEWTRSLEALPELASGARRMDAGGLRLPPPSLRVKVTHTARSDEFLAQGVRASTTVREVVRRSGRDLAELDAVLDFGCGCGRVIRHWVDVSGPRFFGCDYNPDLVEWCAENLTFATFRVNALAPPLPFEDDSFDLVYALSVFTHLTEQLQHEWMWELARAIRPGGLLLFTTRGEAWRHKLSPDESARYDAGELVTRYEAVEGTNLCAAWHPPSYIEDRLLTSFTMVESVPAGLEDGHQDVHLVERRG